MASMPQRKRIVKFEPIELKAAEPGWFVRVTLPHGEQIHINEFRTETEAKDWIADKAAAWLKKYRGGRYA
jgi:hypothetical protein